MIKQKVITMNVLVNSQGVKGKGFDEIEPQHLNQYLEDGYKVVDRFSTVTNGSLYVVNLTFILEKNTED